MAFQSFSPLQPNLFSSAAPRPVSLHPVWLTAQTLWFGCMILALGVTAVGVAGAVVSVAPVNVADTLSHIGHVLQSEAMNESFVGDAELKTPGAVSLAVITPSARPTSRELLQNPTLLEPFVEPAEVPQVILKPEAHVKKRLRAHKKWDFWKETPRAEKAALGWPLANVRISSRFGRRFGTRHEGLDLTAPVGTPVMTSAPGRVTFAGTEQGYGNVITVDHGYGLSTRYAHLSRISVRVGDRVAPKQVIGAVGMTGRTSGPHLHFEVRRASIAQDPTRFVSNVS